MPCNTSPLLIDGQWKLDLHGSDVDSVSLVPFLGLDDRGELKKFGYSDLSVRKQRWNPIRIVTDPDAGEGYEKR